MAFRITNQMIAKQTMRNLSASLARLDTHNRHLSTGKRISVPSDDPAGTEIAMRLRTTMVENEQHINNVGDALSTLLTTDSALGHATEVLHRARVLVLDGANGSVPNEARQAIAMELDQLVQDLIQVGNHKDGSKYIFSGMNTLSEAFVPVYSADGQITSVQYQGTSGEGMIPTVEIGAGITMPVNIAGNEAILPAIEALIAARDRMAAGDTEGLSQQSVAEIDDAMDVLLTARAEVGARHNRLELAKGRMEEAHINFSRLLSDREDVDIAETIMHLKMEENVYRMALASGARILQPTLLDFLR